MVDSGARAEKGGPACSPNFCSSWPSFSFLFRSVKKVGGRGGCGLLLCDRRITFQVILLADLMMTAVRSVMTAPGAFGSRPDGILHGIGAWVA